MKTKLKIALLVFAAILVIAASRFGDPGQKAKDHPVRQCYTQEEVLLLMKANGSSREEAIRLLELSCEYPVTPMTNAQ